jgi:hypothetical protein
MRLLDTAAIVASLAASTGRPHMMIRANATGLRLLRDSASDLLPADVVDEIAASGTAIVSGQTFVDGALDFWNLEQALIAHRIQGVSVRLSQADGSVRVHDAIEAIVADMPARAAA